MDKEHYFFLCEKSSGKLLIPYLIGKRVDMNDGIIRDIFSQILFAILSLKHKMITHRDLKPHNIFVEEEDGKPIVKLNDYFLEQTFNHQKIIKNRYGSIYFTAPEVVEQQHDVDCVMWNFGVILYLVLHGKLPF